MANQYTIASKTHREGRNAYKSKAHWTKNPYSESAVRDSDEWLRYQNWRNGWNFAMFTDSKMRVSDNTKKKVKRRK